MRQWGMGEVGGKKDLREGGGVTLRGGAVGRGLCGSRIASVLIKLCRLLLVLQLRGGG